MQDRPSIVVEEYLQEIYALEQSESKIKAASLASRLQTSPSTVHATLSRMQRDKLININVKKEIQLTKEGSKRAETMIRRHRLVETFLCDKLGIAWHEVHQHAHVLEHGLTPLVEEKLAEFLGFPDSCPHGTPIPGSNHKLPDSFLYLEKAEVGDSIEVVMVSESLEDSLDLMKFLHEKNVIPQKRHQVVEKTSVTNTIVLDSETGSVTLPFEIAKKIGVRLL